MDDCDWYRIQLAFLRDHRYWTASARRLREEQKQRNIAALADLLGRVRGGDPNRSTRRGRR